MNAAKNSDKGVRKANKIDENCWRFPPPPPQQKNDLVFNGVIVRKVGDHQIDNAKQREIYLYSPCVRVGGGYIVLPKDAFKNFNLGDWVSFKKEWAEGGHTKRYEERCVYNINLLSKEMCLDYELPSTTVRHNEVVITEEFVLCPKFIKNPLGNRKLKVIICDMGMGFVETSLASRLKLQDDVVYRGVFTFKDQNAGGTNFAATDRSQWDPSGNPLEMDTLWQLSEVISVQKGQLASKSGTKCVKLENHPKMNEYLSRVKIWAQVFYESYEWREGSPEFDNWKPAETAQGNMTQMENRAPESRNIANVPQRSAETSYRQMRQNPIRPTDKRFQTIFVQKGLVSVKMFVDMYTGERDADLDALKEKARLRDQKIEEEETRREVAQALPLLTSTPIGSPQRRRRF